MRDLVFIQDPSGEDLFNCNLKEGGTPFLVGFIGEKAEF